MTDEERPGVVHAVVDRVVDGTAVLLVGDDEREAHVPLAALPAGAGEGAVLRVRPGDPPAVVGLDAEETARRRDTAERRLDRLRGDRPSDRFAGSGDDPQRGGPV